MVDDASTDGTAAVSRPGSATTRAFAASAPPTERVRLRRKGRAQGFRRGRGRDRDGGRLRRPVATWSCYHQLIEEGYDCAFGSRFVPGAAVLDYPRFKLVINRLANWGIRILFRHRYNDTTNAFKAYRREVIEGVQPLLSNHFNLTVELPLKAIVRGYSYAILPTSWPTARAGARS